MDSLLVQTRRQGLRLGVGVQIVQIRRQRLPGAARLGTRLGNTLEAEQPFMAGNRLLALGLSQRLETLARQLELLALLLPVGQALA